MEKCWSMPMAVLVAVLPLVTAAQISTATTAAGKGWSGLPGPAPQFGPAAQPEPPSPSAESEFAWLWPPPRPAPKIECVAHEFEPAAGLPGLWYIRVGPSGIDAAGNVLFWAYVDGPGVTPANRLAIFYGPPGAAQVLVREGQQAFDMPAGVIVSSLYSAAENISQDGEIVFTATVSGRASRPESTTRSFTSARRGPSAKFGRAESRPLTARAITCTRPQGVSARAGFCS